ncbi:MAG TPA: DUF3052 family protein [Thermoanaerobaculia bacterium]
MAGYSGTPLPKKLGIKEGSRVVLIDAPDHFEAALDPLPGGATIDRLAGQAGQTGPPADVIVFFTDRVSRLEEKLADLAGSLASNGGLWIAWPKKASGVPTDVTFEAVQKAGLAIGLVDNKVCAVDDVWSGLRFVYRLKDRSRANR